MMRSKYATPLLVVVGLLLGVLVAWVFLRTRSTEKDEVPSEHRMIQPHPQPKMEPSSQGLQDSQGDMELVGSQPSKPALVLFYANWCGHSKNFTGTWEQLQNILKTQGRVDTLSFEHGKDEEMMRKCGVGGFPTIRLYPQGFAVEGKPHKQYAGPRTVDAIMKFVSNEV